MAMAFKLLTPAQLRGEAVVTWDNSVRAGARFERLLITPRGRPGPGRRRLACGAGSEMWVASPSVGKCLGRS